MLRTSTSNFSVEFVGPREKIKLTADALSNIAVYAQPGGGGLSKNLAPSTRRLTKKRLSTMLGMTCSSTRPSFATSFLAGGRYLRFCLGAYLAGHAPGFGLLPPGADTDSERSQPDAQVKSERDTVIQVNWFFEHGNRAGQTQKNIWFYFHNGAVLDIPANTTGVHVFTRYSNNDDIAASVTPFGEGWLGLVGPHPEATEDWCEFALPLCCLH